MHLAERDQQGCGQYRALFSALHGLPFEKSASQLLNGCRHGKRGKNHNVIVCWVSAGNARSLLFMCVIINFYFFTPVWLHKELRTRLADFSQALLSIPDACRLYFPKNRRGAAKKRGDCIQCRGFFFPSELPASIGFTFEVLNSSRVQVSMVYLEVRKIFRSCSIRENFFFLLSWSSSDQHIFDLSHCLFLEDYNFLSFFAMIGWLLCRRSRRPSIFPGAKWNPWQVRFARYHWFSKIKWIKRVKRKERWRKDMLKGSKNIHAVHDRSGNMVQGYARRRFCDSEKNALSQLSPVLLHLFYFFPFSFYFGFCASMQSKVASSGLRATTSLIFSMPEGPFSQFAILGDDAPYSTKKRGTKEERACGEWPRLNFIRDSTA